VSADRYLQGLAAVKVLPGPVSTLLAVFLGLEAAGVWGALVSGLSFILPSFLMLLAICMGESVIGPTPHIKAF
jgi:chromate transporter